MVLCWCCIFIILVFSDLLCDFVGLHCCGECAGMPRDWSMQTGKWAVFLEGCESSSGPVCRGTRNFWKELESKLLKRYVKTTYTKVIFQSHIDQLRWCLSSGCTHHIRLTEISGNLGLLATCLACHYLHPKMASQLSRWGYSSGLQHHLQFAFWWTPLGSPQTKASSSANDKIILLIRSSDAHVLQKYSTVLECLRNPSEWKWTDMKTSTVRNKFGLGSLV